MRAAVVDEGGILLRHMVRPTPRDARSPEALVELIRDVARGWSATGAVIGVPGRVDYHAGLLEFAPNLPASWLEGLSAGHLSEVIGMPAALANDADLAAVGEHRFGAGRGYRDIVYMTISTGVGAGVILNDRLARGLRSLAEAGHMVIDRTAQASGDPATLEGQASGTAMTRLAAAAGLAARGHDLVELALAGQPAARAVWDSVVKAVAIGAVNLAHLFSPEIIVVGGGVGLHGEPVLGPIRAELASGGPKGLPAPIEVVNAALGDDAGLTGAAGWSKATS
jgi:glucokinase